MSNTPYRRAILHLYLWTLLSAGACTQHGPGVDFGPSLGSPALDAGTPTAHDAGTLDADAPDAGATPPPFVSFDASLPFDAGGPALDAAVTTRPLAQGERVLGVGPEGDVWLSDGAHAFTYSTDGPSQDLPASLAQASWVSVRGATAGLAIVEGALLQIDDGSTTPVTLPDALGTPSAACGDLDHELFVASPTGLWEHVRDQWFRWDLLGKGDVKELGTLHGACRTGDGLVWFTRGGQLYALDPAPGGPGVRSGELTAVSQLQPDATGGLAVQADRGLFVSGPNFAELTGLDLSPQTWTQGAGSLWVFDATGGSLHARTDGGWTKWQSEKLPTEGVKGMHTDARDGLWLLTDGNLVGVGPLGPRLRIDGLSPWQRVSPGALPLRLHTSEPASKLAVLLDDVKLDATFQMDGDARLLTVNVPDQGPHRLRFETTFESRMDVRELPFVVRPTTVTWESDIAPFFAGRCARCHLDRTNPAPSLGGAQDYRNNISAFVRMTSDGEMPPDLPLSSMEKSLMADWQAAGMPE